MNESISDAILDSGEESILRAYAGLSITAGGVSLQRSELSQSVTVAGALNNEGDPTTVVYLNFVDKDVWSTGKIATAAELIAGRYSKFKLNIVTEKPAEGDFYTVCIGTTEALKEYAASQGLVFDSENPDTKMKTAFAEVNRDLSQNMGDQFVDTYTIMSIGDQLSALLADERPGIGDYSPITLFSEPTSPVVYLNFVDKDVWSTGKIATAAELIAGRYSKFKLNIVTEKPAEGDFYTVCIGTTEALKEYAASQGLVFDSENPDTKMKTAFAEVNRDLSQNMGDQFVDTYTIMSIGDQLSALLADERPGIGDYSPITLFSESNNGSLIVPESDITIEDNDYGNAGVIFGFDGLTWDDFVSNNFYHGYSYADNCFVDAEKSLANDKDVNMCWAAAASNVLYFTHWTVSSMTSEDDVLDYFRDSFQYGDERGGLGKAGIEWYLTGDYALSNRIDADQPLPNEGGLFVSSVDTCSSYLNGGEFFPNFNIFSYICSKLDEGNAVTIGITRMIGSDSYGGHEITIWGVGFDTNYAPNNVNYYKSIIVTDSDDDYYRTNDDPRSASDVLKILPITWNSTYGYYQVSSDYMQVGACIINQVTILSPAAFVTVTSGNNTFAQGATLTDQVLSSGMIMNVSSAGLAMDTTVTSGGIQTVLANGTALDTIVSSGGTMSILSGGKVTGRTTIESGADVSAASGAIIDFNISDHVSIQTALVSDLSLIQGAPGYTLTVSSSTGSGLYRLADNASGFGQTVSVFDAGETTSSGTLTLSQRTNIEGVNYLLNNADNLLTVFVTKTQTIHPDYFNGHFSGGTGAIFAKQSGNTVDFYAGGSSWGSSLSLGSGWDAVGAGDFNGDGKDDVLRINDDGYVVAEFSNGSGTFSSSQVLNMLGTGWSIVGIGDFNDNGTDDVLVANPTAASSATGLVGYWEGCSTWTLIGGSELEWQIVATGDFNADGKCDTLWRNSFIGELDGRTYNAYYTWITGEPLNGSHWRKVEAALANVWDFLCSGDFNGDGTDDVALINGSGEVGVWGVSNGIMSSWNLLNYTSGIDPSAWTFAGVGDFNGDGTDDIAWCNNSTNYVGYWSIINMQLDPSNSNMHDIGTIA